MKIGMLCTSVDQQLADPHIPSHGKQFVASFSVLAGDADDGLTLKTSVMKVITAESVYEVGRRYIMEITPA